MKLSILITAYNAQATIKRCVDSVLDQSLDDYEIIVVNDGSSDQTAKLLEAYADNPRVKILHQANGGVSKARNCALDHAQGEYITYLDSDDFAVSDCYKDLYNIAEREQADLLIYDSFFDYGTHTGYFHMGGKAEEGIISAKQYILSEPCPWNKLMKRSLFTDQNYHFEEGMIYEDYSLIPRLANKANKIVYVKKPCIHYWQSEESIMRGAAYKPRSVDIVKASRLLIEGMDLNRFHDETEAIVVEHLLQNGCRYFLAYGKLAEIEEAATLMRTYFPHWTKNPYLANRSRKERLIGWLFVHHQAKLVQRLVSSKKRIRSEKND